MTARLDLSKLSAMERLAMEDEPAYRAFLDRLRDNDEHAKRLLYDWSLWARPNQRIPAGDDWSLWLFMGGRGVGKTRTGAEFARWCAERYERGHMVARTAGDVRDVMIEGESGILATAPPAFRPTYRPSVRELRWPNGAIAKLFSADEPESLRGPQCGWFWGDEGATWRMYPAKRGEAQPRVREPDAWSNLMMGWRLGSRPVGLMTTTPRPAKWLRALMQAKSTYLTTGTTYENLRNLSPQFRANVIAKYEGTKLAEQELMGLILDEVDGALWTSESFDAYRVASIHPSLLRRIVIGVDPAGSANSESDLTGIVAVGKGQDGRAYVLDDWSGRYSAEAWARRAVELHDKWQADAIVAERNNGGDMVRATLTAAGKRANIRTVWASRGKHIRAEPVSALYEQGKVSHVGLLDAYGNSPFAELEQQAREMTRDGYTGDDSPDRLEAMIWAMYDLFRLAEPHQRAGVLFAS